MVDKYEQPILPPDGAPQDEFDAWQPRHDLFLHFNKWSNTLNGKEPFMPDREKNALRQKLGADCFENPEKYLTPVKP